MSKDVNEMTAVLDRHPTPVAAKATPRKAKLRSLLLPALAIAVPLLAPVAVAEGFITLAEMAQSVQPAVSSPAAPVSPSAPALSRVDADATAPEYGHIEFGPASALPTTVERIDLQIATERP